MSSIINSIDIFNAENSDGSIKFCQYNSSSGVLDNPISKISFNNAGHLSFDIDSKNSGTGKYIDFTHNINETSLMRLTDSGRLGLGTTSPLTKLHIKQIADDQLGGNLGDYKEAGLIIERKYDDKKWCFGVNSYKDLVLWYNKQIHGWFLHSATDSNNVGEIDFTGQHRCFYNDYSINTLKEMEGLIVSANKNSYTSMSGSITKGLNAISISDSIPDISLCNKEKDKDVFGVISATEDPAKRENTFGNFISVHEKEVGDTRPYINSLGEGAIWVSNKDGELENGDYITSSTIPGYGTKQDDDFLRNYTVAKITMDCNFSPQNVPKKIILKDNNEDNILDSNGYLQFVDHASETELQYNIRYLQSDGTIITESEYNTRLGNGESVYKAAFVGCTYHCG